MHDRQHSDGACYREPRGKGRELRPAMKREASAAPVRQNRLAVVLALGIICFLEIRCVQLIQARSWDLEVKGAFGIVHGTAEWRVYQNRLLGPWCIQGIAALTHRPFESAYKTGFSILMAVPVFLCFALVRRVTRQTRDSFRAAIAFAVAIVALQDRSWFYLWDAIDLSTMLLFAYAVMYARDNLRILVPLFFVELLNRESAGFIALWIIVYQTWKYFAYGAVDVRRLFLGAGLLIGGAAWTRWIRQTLFLHSINPAYGLDRSHAVNGEHFQLFRNLNNFIHPYDGTGFAVAVLCCAGLLLLFRRLSRAKEPEGRPIVILLSVMMLAVWIFGAVTETRVWLEFIPFAIFVGLKSYHGQTASNVLDTELHLV
jgi:hypothetical protein